MSTNNKVANLLVDSFGRAHTYLRISVTDRCNLRCRYCMPADGLVWKKKDEMLTYEEIERLAKIFVPMGIDKIRLTGGEPLVRKDLLTLVKKLAPIENLKTLAMTTNATLLAPQAKALRQAGLTHLNISLDSLRKERFEAITRLDSFDEVMAGIMAAIESGYQSLKINVVAIAGFNDDEILDFVAFAQLHKVNVRFIEFMPFKDNEWNIDKVVTYSEMKARIEEHYSLTHIVQSRSDVSKDFALAGGGSVSFITSMSESFCGTCNRLRLTGEGSIKSCLFYPAELSLRDAMRQGASDEAIRQLILQSLAAKPEAHPPAEEIAAQENRTMIEIGG